jgi:hydrogenase maturation protease
VVIGLGDVVLSDDGLGVHAVRRLRERPSLPEGIELIEGGTAGLLLLPWLADSERVIIIDAIDTGAPPGTLVRLEGDDWATAFDTRMTVHDVGLRDLLATAQLTGAWPQRLVLHGVQPATTAIGIELSAPVAGALGQLVSAVLAELAELAAWDQMPAPPGTPRLPAADIEARACA